MQGDSENLHDKAVEAADRCKKCDAELIEILIQVQNAKVYAKRGHSSLFKYIVHDLGLSESVAYNLTSVIKVVRIAPELKTKIESGSITLSNARTIASVITKENKSEWLGKATALSHRQLEKAVAAVNPQAATPERAKYTSGNRVKLELGVSEDDMLRFRKMQDILSQKLQRSASLEETLRFMLGDCEKRHDPVMKAKRSIVRQNSKPKVFENQNDASAPVTLQEQARHDEVPLEIAQWALGRTPTAAQELHRVNLRDQRRCSHTGPDGKRCGETRFLQIHHVIPVSQGGKNTVENLKTLCTTHHALIHDH